MEVNQGQLLKLISVIYKSIEVNHSMKLIRTPFLNTPLVVYARFESKWVLDLRTNYLETLTI